MCNFVIKRDGKKEQYDPNKIEKAIASAAVECDLKEAEILDAVEETCGMIKKVLANLDEISTKDIRDMILIKLDTNWPSIAECWREYEADYIRSGKQGKA